MIRSFASSTRKKKQIGREERTEGEKKLKGEGVRKGGGGQETKKRRSGERKGMSTNQEKRERPVGDKK